MSQVNLAAIDLNLLLVVHAVLEQKSATLAAARLHVTQSAVSNALRRAREIFGDPLVVRTGRGFAPTPRAEAIAPRLRAIVEEARGVLREGTAFRPETTTRRFTIAATDAVGMVLVPALLPLLEARMPRARLRLVTLDRVVAAGGLEHADVDLLIGMPPTIAATCDAEVLYEDPMLVLVREGHPRVRRRLSLSTYVELPHAELALFGEPEGYVDRALAARGLTREVQVMVPHIAVLPFVVAGSDRVATTISTLARAFVRMHQLRALPPPIALPPIVVRQIWHRRASADPAHALLRELVRSAAKQSTSARRAAAR